jgi:transposase-like protein
MSNLAHLRDEAAALAKLEEIVWPQGPVCPHCGETRRIGRVTGRGARHGLRLCLNCRRQFRATLGTIFEGSHVPLHKWFQACLLLAHRHIGARRLHRLVGVSYKTALRITRQLAAAVGGELRIAGDLDEILQKIVSPKLPPDTARRRGVC